MTEVYKSWKQQWWFNNKAEPEVHKKFLQERIVNLYKSYQDAVKIYQKLGHGKETDVCHECGNSNSEVIDPPDFFHPAHFTEDRTEDTTRKIGLSFDPDCVQDAWYGDSCFNNYLNIVLDIANEQ
jgi:hypothetical protein